MAAIGKHKFTVSIVVNLHALLVALEFDFRKRSFALNYLSGEDALAIANATAF